MKPAARRRDRHRRALAAAAAADPGTGGAMLARALRHAIEVLRAEQFDTAERALRDILERWPGEPNAQHYLGVLRHAQGRTGEAVALIERSLVAAPDNAGAWNNLGNVQLSAGRVDAAVHAYERGVEAAAGDPMAANALNNLGTVYRTQGRLDDAEAACRRALALRPEFGDAWYNLSLALMAQGRIHDGLIANSRAIASWPRHLQARDQVIRALLLLGESGKAAALYREWLAEEPDNPVVRHQLAACLGADAPERASDAYLQQVFDAFASSFDAKLEKLRYRAPALVAEALHRVLGAPVGGLDIVDAGCGTGLCGPRVRSWARRLVGCDLSAGMLRRASEQHVYDVLHQAELTYYLDTQPEAFDIVISADTLCYFGALDTALAAARRSLRAGGWLVFTVEALPAADRAGHRLQAYGRYAHSKGYLESAVAGAGLSLVTLADGTLRLEAGLAVAGWVVTARRPSTEESRPDLGPEPRDAVATPQ